jgi:dipeptidase E
MKRTNFEQVVRKKLDDGCIYIGTSAGGIVTCPDIGYIGDLDSPEKATLDDNIGLNLTDFYIMPHIDHEYFAEGAKKIAANSHTLDKPLWGLTDSQGLLCHGNYIEIIESA